MSDEFVRRNEEGNRAAFGSSPNSDEVALFALARLLGSLGVTSTDIATFTRVFKVMVSLTGEFGKDWRLAGIIDEAYLRSRNEQSTTCGSQGSTNRNAPIQFVETHHDPHSRVAGDQLSRKTDGKKTELLNFTSRTGRNPPKWETISAVIDGAFVFTSKCTFSDPHWRVVGTGTSTTKRGAENSAAGQVLEQAGPWHVS